MSATLLKPVDWITKSNDPWENRLSFEQFTLSGLNDLEQKLRIENKANATSLSKARLATLLVQRLPSRARAFEAFGLLQSITDLNILNEFSTLRSLVRSILREPIQKKHPIVRVNWGIYNRCPLVCSGCYNIFNSNILSLKQCYEIAEQLIEADVAELILSGGDPLSWPHLVEFCGFLKKQGVRVGIDTTGYVLTQDLVEQLKDKISYIGIPLDGPNQETIQKFRHGKNDLFEKTVKNLLMLSDFEIPIRLNTTVHKMNSTQLEAIKNIAEQIPSIHDWSLYQWWPLRTSPLLSKKMYITDLEFKKSVINLESKNINISKRGIADRTGGTVFIASNGEVYAFSEAQMAPTIIIGDLKTTAFQKIVNSPVIHHQSRKFSSIPRFYRNQLTKKESLCEVV